MPPNKVINPHSQATRKKLLTRLGSPVTLEGGTEGSDQDAKHHPLVSSVEASSETDMARAAHDALSAMVAGFIGRDRRLLDEGFEALVECIEEMRDAVPKA